MKIGNLRDIIKPSPVLASDDTIAKAIRLLRRQGLPLLPVAQGGQLIGLVYETDLVEQIYQADDPRQAARTTLVQQITRPIPFIASELHDLSTVSQALRDPSAAAVPVSAPDGRYLGLLLRRDLLAALAGEPLLPPMAGLATPFGVHLTTGALRAGAGDFALAATGVALMLLNLLATGLVYGFAWSVDRLLPVSEAAAQELPPNLAFAAVLVAYALQIGLFLLLLRLSPLTGIHASEHMVVHAIEEGEDLTLEKVRAMPRVHRRCGTNLMALLILLIIGQQFVSALSAKVDEATGVLALLALVVIVLVTWRRLGSGLQRWVTTRPPSDRQLSQAIRAGEELIAGVQARPGARAGLRRRLWNGGFVQVTAGFAAVAIMVHYLGPLLASAWSQLTG